MKNSRLNFYNNKVIHQVILEELGEDKYLIFKHLAKALEGLQLIQMFCLNLYKMEDKMQLQDKMDTKCILMEKWITIITIKLNKIKIICNNFTKWVWIKQVLSNKECKYLITNNNKDLLQVALIHNHSKASRLPHLQEWSKELTSTEYQPQ